MEMSFGTKTSHLKSNIDELDHQTIIAIGGNGGAVLGNSFSTFSIKPLGFYTGLGISGRNISLYTFEVENNNYLFRSLTRKPSGFNVFTTPGIGYNSYTGGIGMVN